MMDKLINSLLEQISELNLLFQKAPEQQSELGIEHQRPTKNDLSSWQELTDMVHKKREQLAISISGGINDKNKCIVDQELGFFRQLPRQMDYYPVYWSAYSPEIQKLNSQIAINLGKIDKNYTLGKYLMREKIAKYQS